MIKDILTTLIIAAATLFWGQDPRTDLQARIYGNWTKFVQADGRQVEVLLPYQTSLQQCPPAYCFDIARIDQLKAAIVEEKIKLAALEDNLKAEQFNGQKAHHPQMHGNEPNGILFTEVVGSPATIP